MLCQAHTRSLPFLPSLPHPYRVPGFMLAQSILFLLARRLATCQLKYAGGEGGREGKGGK